MDKKCEDMSCMDHCCLGSKHRAVRLILGIVILFCVYWLGVRMGEIRGTYDYGYGYGYGMMGQGYWGPGYMMRGYNYPMMYRYGVSLPVSVSATSTY